MKRGLEKFYNLIDALEGIPSIGRKSAQRIAYNMVFQDKFNALKIAHAIESAISHIQPCSQCGGMSEDEICEICSDEFRDKETLCIVESAKDVFIIEESNQYKGRYFVLTSLEELDLEKLTALVKDGIEEIIFALTPGLASDSIMLFIEDKLQDFDLMFTRIAQGVPTGVHIENVDTLSLTRALHDRTKL